MNTKPSKKPVFRAAPAASLSSVDPAQSAPSTTVVTVPPAELQALETACTHFAMALGGSAVTLSKGQIARLPKPRKNASTFVSLAVMAGEKYGIASPSYPVADIQANQALADALAPAIDAVQSLLKLLRDTALLSQSQAWKGATVLYRMLSTEAGSNASVETSIGPMREMLRPHLLTPEGTKTVKRSRSAKVRAKAAVEEGSGGGAAGSGAEAASVAATPVVAHGSQNPDQ